MYNENEFNYSSDNHFRKAKIEKKSSFGKNIVVPFLSGIVGASLVIGVCFGVPSIKNTLISSNNTTVPTFSAPTKQENSINSTDLTNIANYSDTASTVARTVLPSIVGIEVTYNVNSFWGTSQGKATGSGIIISEDGYIITNNHVISAENSSSSYYQITEATELKVKLYDNDTEYKATVVGTDSYTDLAVIKIDATGLTPATLGDSDSVSVGEFAMAIGNPLGMDFTVTAGIISAVNREVAGEDGSTYLAIQTDAAINSGNSGGALVNSKGEVIGINTLKLSGAGIEGVGFAIPINSTTDVISQLIEFKTVKRPYIGVSAIAIDSATAELYNLPKGVSVREIAENSPAKEAGIQVGDIITKIEGTEISTVPELNQIKYKYNIGDTVTLTILRDGKEKDIKILLGEEPEITEEEKNSEKNTQTVPDTHQTFPSIWDLFR